MAPFVNPARFWPLAFLGLAFPILLLLVLFFLFFWLVLAPRYSLLSLGALLVGFRVIGATFAFHLNSSHAPVKPGSITILSYNVHYFRPYNDTPDQKGRIGREMLGLIRDQHPDIACFPEYFTRFTRGPGDYEDFIRDSIGLKYKYYSSDPIQVWNYVGTTIYSRFPLVGEGRIPLAGSGENALFADIADGKDTFRVFAMHLQSIHLTPSDLAGIEQVKRREDSGFAASRTVLGKIRRAFMKRGEQADRIAEAVSQSPYPVIVCGDFNDTPDSYTYFRVRGRLQDAFLEKGFGIGRTYMGISPTLRIDYILADRHFRVNGFSRIPRALSDHYPITANLSFSR